MSLSFLAASLTQILGLVVDGLFTTPEVDSFDSTVELFAVVIVSTTKPHRAAGSRVLDPIFVRGDQAFGVTAVTPAASCPLQRDLAAGVAFTTAKSPLRYAKVSRSSHR